MRQAHARRDGGDAARHGQRATTVRKDLAEIEVPTLVLGGEDDVPVAGERAGTDGAGNSRGGAEDCAPRRTLCRLEQPEEVGRLVREFLERNGR